MDDCLLHTFDLGSGSGWDLATLFAAPQVSRRWRLLAISNGAMWSQISINEKSIHHLEYVRGSGAGPSGPSTVFPVVALMLQRSRQHTLDIRIRIPEFKAFHSFHIDILVRLLFPHCTRIARFKAKSVSWKYHGHLLKIFTAESLPLLRSLDIQCPRPSEGGGIELGFPPNFPLRKVNLAPFVNGQAAPNIKELCLLRTFCDWAKFASRNLTTLILSDIPFADRPTNVQLRSMLAMSQDTLKMLRIEKALPCKKGGDVDILEMPHLETLSIVYTLPHELSVFVDHIRLPALNIGNVTPCQRPEVQVELYRETLAVFKRISRHFPVAKLRSVTLCNVQFGPEASYGLLAHSESLEFLRRLGTGIRKMLFVSGKKCFMWTDGMKDSERVLAAWRQDVERGLLDISLR